MVIVWKSDRQIPGEILKRRRSEQSVLMARFNEESMHMQGMPSDLRNGRRRRKMMKFFIFLFCFGFALN